MALHVEVKRSCKLLISNPRHLKIVKPSFEGPCDINSIKLLRWTCFAFCFVFKPVSVKRVPISPNSLFGVFVQMGTPASSGVGPITHLQRLWMKIDITSFFLSWTLIKYIDCTWHWVMHFNRRNALDCAHLVAVSHLLIQSLFCCETPGLLAVFTVSRLCSSLA